MNDFSELENELRKLRPALPSPVLFQRIGEALEDYRSGASPAGQPGRLLYNWWSLGFGLAAAAILVVFAVINFQSTHERREAIAASSAPQPEIRTLPRGIEQSTLHGRFVSAGGAHVVYNARDEGLQFANGSARPVRRVRYQTEQTWRWRNPETGASLRVSYPSEEIVLIPVSGQ
jgi:hypothetical protein